MPLLDLFLDNFKSFNKKYKHNPILLLKMIIGLTGYLGSGKTTIANLFRDLGANIIDADKIGHIVFAENHKLIQELFLTTDKQQISDIVFDDIKRLEQLNNLTHSKIKQKIQQKIQKHKINIIDAAVLIQLDLKEICDKIILVKSETPRSDLKPEKIKKIISTQKMPKNPDYIIQNNNLNKTKQQITELWQKLVYMQEHLTQ